MNLWRKSLFRVRRRERPSVRGLLLGRVPQAASFDQVVEVLCEVGGVVSGALQSLRHQQYLKSGRVALRHGFCQMLLKESMADAIDLLIHLQHFAGTVQIERGKTLMNQ